MLRNVGRWQNVTSNLFVPCIRVETVFIFFVVVALWLYCFWYGENGFLCSALAVWNSVYQAGRKLNDL